MPTGCRIDTASGSSELGRRAFLKGSFALVGLGGCATTAGIPEAEISDAVPTGLTPILAPPRIQTWTGQPTTIIDVHAHFFNARDVPVQGYLGGPIAHSKGGVVGALLAALAPLANWLAATAPSAKREFDELVSAARGASLTAASRLLRAEQLDETRSAFLADASQRFYEQVQREAPDFVRIYNEHAARVNILGGAGGPRGPLRADSLRAAMLLDEKRVGPTIQSFTLQEPPEYADGVLAFVGYMLSYRWMNLVGYQRAYTSDPGAFGVQQVLGAMVDFDYWLTPPPTRTSQEDQIKVQRLLSELSRGYMRPLVAYNPWKDVADQGKTRQRVVKAIESGGCVGAKIYPPNGFRPFGNVALPLPSGSRLMGMPLDADLDRALLDTWRALAKLEAPMMAHAGHSMGKSEAFSEMAGPEGYEELRNAIGANPAARVQLGHFGGDNGQFPWTMELAKMMETASGGSMYGDLGYWDSLRCARGVSNCPSAQRLAEALRRHPEVANRLMYGSDWLMLSQERRWDRYPFDILAATRAVLDPDALFGANAKACYPRLQAPIV